MHLLQPFHFLSTIENRQQRCSLTGFNTPDPHSVFFFIRRLCCNPENRKAQERRSLFPEIIANNGGRPQRTHLCKLSEIVFFFHRLIILIKQNNFQRAVLTSFSPAAYKGCEKQVPKTDTRFHLPAAQSFSHAFQNVRRHLSTRGRVRYRNSRPEVPSLPQTA